VVLVRTTHVGVGTEGKVGAVDRQRLGVNRITAGRERRVVLRTKVEVFPVLSDVREGIATHHGRVVSLVVVVVGMEGRLEVVGSPGDVSPGRVLATILLVVKVGHVRANRVGIIELLHERTSRVGIGNLVLLLLLLLLPGIVDN
jgi:hypothetical protein